MRVFVADQPGIEASGRIVVYCTDVTKRFTSLSAKILINCGISSVRPDAWYPFQSLLNAFRELQETVGGNTLFAVGKLIPSYAAWPPELDTIEAALASIDVAYHMNHRLNGEVMYDAATGTMKEGIGHYHFHLDGIRRAVMICDNPYPSDFDRGILSSLARRFKPLAEVTLDTSRPNRMQGGDTCTFIIRW